MENITKWDHLILGGLLFSYTLLFLYHFSIFITGKRRDKSNISYAFFNLGIALVLFGDNFYRYFISSQPGANGLIIILAVNIIGWSLISFIYQIFDLKQMDPVTAKFSSIPWISQIIFSTYSLITIIIYLFSFNSNILSLFNIVQSIIVNGLFFFLSLFLLIYYTKMTQKQKIVSIGIFFAFLCLSYNTVIFMLEKRDNYYISHSGFFVMALLFAFTLIKSFNEQYEEKLSLNQQLNKTTVNLKNAVNELNTIKSNLELTVENRTAELKDANSQLKEEKSSTINFFTNVAHEIRTPASGISIGITEYKKTNPVSNDYLNLIEKCNNKLLSIIADLLDLKAIQTGKAIYNHNQIILLSQYIIDIIKEFEKRAELKRISIIQEIESEIYTKADPGAIDRIMGNLLSNAIKYTNPGGTIKIILKKLKQKIIIQMSDTGIGITANHLENIFKPYFQIKHQKKNSQGIGIGLSIVKEVVDSLKGEISVNSTINKGTEFKLTLNKYDIQTNDHPEICKPDLNHFANDDNSDPDTIQKLNLSIPYNDQLPTILYVDDQTFFLDLLKSKFKEKFNIYCALNGKKALEELSTLPSTPDIIISDIMMDEMDGEVFLQKIRKNEKLKNIPFIFITAVLDHEKKLEAAKQGIEYITKPFSMDILSAKIDNILYNNEQKYEIVQKKKNELRKIETKKRLDLLKDQFNLSEGNVETIKFILKKIPITEIAAQTFTSIDAVKKSRYRLFTKINVKNSKELLDKWFNSSD